MRLSLRILDKSRKVAIRTCATAILGKPATQQGFWTAHAAIANGDHQPNAPGFAVRKQDCVSRAGSRCGLSGGTFAVRRTKRTVDLDSGFDLTETCGGRNMNFAAFRIAPSCGATTLASAGWQSGSCRERITNPPVTRLHERTPFFFFAFKKRDRMKRLRCYCRAFIIRTPPIHEADRALLA